MIITSALYRSGVCTGGLFLEIGFQPRPHPAPKKFNKEKKVSAILEIKETSYE